MELEETQGKKDDQNRIKLFNEDRIVSMVEAIIRGVKEGEINPLDAHIASEILKKASEKIKSEVEENILQEAEIYPTKEFTYKGITFVKSSNTKYEFDDPSIDEWKKKIKERQELLKTIKEEIVLPETGELLKPAIKKSKSYVYIRKPRASKKTT